MRRVALPLGLASGDIRMSVDRRAVATTWSCWLRIVCRNSTIPCPGRDVDARFDATTVSA